LCDFAPLRENCLPWCSWCSWWFVRSEIIIRAAGVVGPEAHVVEFLGREGGGVAVEECGDGAIEMARQRHADESAGRLDRAVARLPMFARGVGRRRPVIAGRFIARGE